MSSTEPDDWYAAETYPELRPHAPWVMEDMIAAEAGLPDRLVDAAAQAREVADELRRAVQSGAPVVVTGMGTSGHAARQVAMLLNDAIDVTGPGVPVTFRDASEQSAVPARGGLCLAISHGGMSRSTVDALGAARDAGARTALITASPGTPAAESAEIVLSTPLQDASYCHTVGYLSPILASTQIASAYRGEAFPSARVTAYLRALEDIGSAAAAVGSAIGGVQRVIAAGSLHDAPSARELSLKIAEGARLPTSALGVEDTLHGYLAGHDEGTALVVFVTSGPGDKRIAPTADHLLRASRLIGLQTAAIVSESLTGLIGDDAVNAGRVVLPESESGLPRSWTSVLGAALALQHLTIGLVHARGVNPDLIRREERPYREAVQLGETKAPRD